MSKVKNFLRSSKGKRILSVTALVFWMGLIFMFSDQDSQTSGTTSGVIENKLIDMTVEDIDAKTPYDRRIIREKTFAFVRNSAHCFLFAVLSLFGTITLLTFDFKPLKSSIISVIFSTLYAMSDEIHQHFVPGRTFEWEDFGIDVLGVVLGAVAVLVFMLIVKVAKRKKNVENC